MSFRFEPEDFIFLNEDVQRQYVSWQANRLLDEFIQTLPEIGLRKYPVYQGDKWLGDEQTDCEHTHRARLWGVEEIKPREHERHCCNQ